MSAIVPPKKIQERKRASYLLWLGILMGIGGLHRLNTGKYVSVILWQCPYRLYCIGKLEAKLLISDM
ncbi:MAG: hypothetical protein ACFB2W_03530, partial [Leptolyngbyaceae cyanobacterium]